MCDLGVIVQVNEGNKYFTHSYITISEHVNAFIWIKYTHHLYLMNVLIFITVMTIVTYDLLYKFLFRL